MKNASTVWGGIPSTIVTRAGIFLLRPTSSGFESRATHFRTEMRKRNRYFFSFLLLFKIHLYNISSFFTHRIKFTKNADPYIYMDLNMVLILVDTDMSGMLYCWITSLPFNYLYGFIDNPCAWEFLMIKLNKPRSYHDCNFRETRKHKPVGPLL